MDQDLLVEVLGVVADPFVALALAALLVGVPAVVFVRRWRRERRSLWLGIDALALAACSVVALMLVAIALGSEMLAVAVLVLVVLAVVVLDVIAPVVLVALFVINGIRLVRREGLRPANALSLALGVLILAYDLAWPSIRGSLPRLYALDVLFAVIEGVINVTVLVAVVYQLSAWLNLWASRGRSYDHVVVLGAGLMPDGRVTPLLGNRVRVGVKAWRQSLAERPGARLVMSGGQGADEATSEAGAMRAFATGELGVPAEAVLVEERSENTRQNLGYSFELMGERDGDAGDVLVVSDNYHVFRALQLAKQQGLACDGRGSRVKLYFSLNAVIREFVALLVMWRRPYLAACGVSAVLAIVGLALFGTSV